MRYTRLAYRLSIVLFVETPTFTRLIVALLSDDEYAALQADLAANPERGDLIRGGGGIRKLRWAAIRQDGRILMLLAYPKSRKDTLTATETATLRRLVKEL